MSDTPHRVYMQRALELAAQAAAAGEVPVGAVIVRDGEIIGEGYNAPITTHDPSGHAEIRALRDAAEKVGNYRLPGATLYVTIEPCTMCAGAIVHARINHVVFGATEPRAGAVESNGQFFACDFLNHKTTWEGGVQADACGEVMQRFFRDRRA